MALGVTCQVSQHYELSTLIWATSQENVGKIVLYAVGLAPTHQEMVVQSAPGFGYVRMHA